MILHSFLYVYQRVCRVSCLELDMIHMIMSNLRHPYELSRGLVCKFAAAQELQPGPQAAGLSQLGVLGSIITGPAKRMCV